MLLTPAPIRDSLLRAYRLLAAPFQFFFRGRADFRRRSLQPYCRNRRMLPLR